LNIKGFGKVVANMGFLLQITGLLLILPVAIGLQNNELQAVASIVTTCFIAFGVGFVFNAFAERKKLDERTSLWLMILSFTVIPLLLMIPYVWNNVFNSTNIIDLFSNSYFEAISGFTTTGFSFVSNPELLPSSLLFYRSLVEFIGGVGFIYILIAFLYPKKEIDRFCDTFGIEKIGNSLKALLLTIMLVYTFFVVIFTAIFYFTYSPNLIYSSCAAIDILTGGYQPNITAGIGIFQVSIILLMFIGALNFRFHYNLFHLKLRELLTPEIKLFLILIAASTIITSILAWINPFDSFFHVVSTISSTGADYLGIGAMALPAKIYFIVLGLFGGCAFSMAGGIRIQRIQKLIDAIRKNEDAPTRDELKTIIIYLTTFIAFLFLLSFAFSFSGNSMLDSVFEIGSALSTNGVSMGATTINIAVGYKWLIIVAMLVGRIEILTIYRAIRGTTD
jgi:trk system potassium uptake protein TrkH